MSLDLFADLLPIILSSAGISGSIIAAVTVFAVKRLKSDAEQKRAERLKLEILRLEGEERLSALLFAMLRYFRGVGDEKELDNALKAYNDYLQDSNSYKNQIIGIHTAN